MAEVISNQVPFGYYQIFYVYLYVGSFLFLVSVYIDVLRTKAKHSVSKQRNKIRIKKDSQKNFERNQESQSPSESLESPSQAYFSVIDKLPRPLAHYGSFYLRVGCVSKSYNTIIWYLMNDSVSFSSHNSFWHRIHDLLWH